MQLIILADAHQKQELANTTPHDNVVWIGAEEEFLQRKNADAFLDLTFVNTAERRSLLQQLLPKPVIVNSVVDTLAEINSSFIRINGWLTFLSSSFIEAAGTNEQAKAGTVNVFSFFNKKIEWLADEPGFVTARVVSMIINEAFLALSEGVSTKDEINKAMKLGTAYPYGPFEWAEKIGMENIVALLEKLSTTHSRYKRAEWLVKEAAEG